MIGLNVRRWGRFLRSFVRPPDRKSPCDLKGLTHGEKVSEPEMAVQVVEGNALLGTGAWQRDVSGGPVGRTHADRTRRSKNLDLDAGFRLDLSLQGFDGHA
jgi:hypothetical protein